MIKKYGMLIWRIIGMAVAAVALGYFINERNTGMVILFTILLVLNLAFTVVLIKKQRMQDRN